MRFLASVFVVLASLAAGPGFASSGEKLTVYLDWFVNPDHAPLVIAKEKLLGRYIKPARNRLAETILIPLVKLSTPFCLTT